MGQSCTTCSDLDKILELNINNDNQIPNLDNSFDNNNNQNVIVDGNS